MIRRLLVVLVVLVVVCIKTVSMLQMVAIILLPNASPLPQFFFTIAIAVKLHYKLISQLF